MSASKTRHFDPVAATPAAVVHLHKDNALDIVDHPTHEQCQPVYSSCHAVTQHLASWTQVAAADQGNASAAAMLSFGRFRVFPSQRLLLEKDRPLRLGSRAFDVLVVLLDRAGGLVTKNELRNLVWPGTFVADDNLKVQIAALRRTLRDGEDGNRYISTVAGRGYWFVSPVVRSRDIEGDAIGRSSTALYDN